MALMKRVSIAGEDFDIVDLTDEQLLAAMHEARSEASAVALSGPLLEPFVPGNISVEKARRTQIEAKLKALTIEARHRKLQVD